MKIVFLTTAHNSLSQRAFVELIDRRHRVIVMIASSEDVMLEAVEREHPDLIVLPKQVGEEKARELTTALLPISTSSAQQIGLIDDAFDEDATSSREHISQIAEELASNPCYKQMLEKKHQTRKNDEARKPLQAYRDEELQHMWLNFFGADQSYHLARKIFVYKGLTSSPAEAIV
jgi:enoyl-CoA hydratase/carnithine racemase